MPNLNKVMLMGNLTRKPELRYTPGGTAVCEFGMAINRKWKGKDGGDSEETCFVDCTAWAKTGEVIAEHLDKGQPIFVEGRLTFEQWEKDGQRRSKLKVTVDQFQFLGSPKRDGQGGPPSVASSRAPAEQAAPQGDPNENGGFSVDGDIPF